MFEGKNLSFKDFKFNFRSLDRWLCGELKTNKNNLSMKKYFS